jgi:hypothetical protein
MNNLKFELHQIYWNLLMFVKTRHFFYLRVINAQFKDMKRNYLHE